MTAHDAGLGGGASVAVGDLGHHIELLGRDQGAVGRSPRLGEGAGGQGDDLKVFRHAQARRGGRQAIVVEA